MITNAANLQALYVNLKGEFQKAYQEQPSVAETLATRSASTSSKNTYGWLGQFAGLREWLGDKQLKNFTAHDYTIVNKNFEDTFVIDRNTIADDTFGMFAPMAAMMGQAAKLHPDQLLFGALNDGDATVCYDGQFMFDTDHPQDDGSTQSNFTAGAAAPWYLMDLSRPIKPLIWQVREQYKFINMISPDDEQVFMQRQYRYGCEGRVNAGYGLWQFAHRSEATLDATAFGAAYEAMIAIEGDAGRPLGVVPTHLVVPTTHWAAATKIIEQERNDSGASNIYYNRVKLIVSPFLDAS